MTFGFPGAPGTENSSSTTPTPQTQTNVDIIKMDFDAIDLAERISTEDSIVPAVYERKAPTDTLPPKVKIATETLLLAVNPHLHKTEDPVTTA